MKKLVAAVALLLALPVFAQDYYPVQDYGLRKNTTRMEFYGGMVLPQSNYQPHGVDLGTTGWTAGLAFQRNVMPFFGLGLDANYAQLGDGDKKAGAYYRTGIATGLVTGRVSFFPSQATRLYIPFGVGIGHTFARQEKADGSHETTDGTGFAQMLGAGLEFDIDETMILGVEGRYYLIEAASDFKEKFDKSRYHHISVMLKFGCRF